VQSCRFRSRLVELRVPWPEIERRLRAGPTSGRLDDLRDMRAWIESGAESPRGMPTIEGDRPIAEVASEILHVLRWPG
jgi:hypothetical protein